MYLPHFCILVRAAAFVSAWLYIEVDMTLFFFCAIQVRIPHFVYHKFSTGIYNKLRTQCGHTININIYNSCNYVSYSNMTVCMYILKGLYVCCFLSKHPKFIEEVHYLALVPLKQSSVAKKGCNRTANSLTLF